MKSYIKPILISIAIGITTWASAADQSSSEFLINAIQGNNAEVQLGQLAQQKSTNSEIQNFGRTLEKDHGAANETARQLAESSNVNVPAQVNKQQKTMYDHLTELSGTQFDKEFMKMMIEAHQKDISKYESQAEHGNDSISQYARKTLPTLHHHLDMAEQISKDIQ